MRFGFNYGVGKGSGRYRNSFLVSYLMDTVYTDGAMDRFLDNVGSNGSNNDAVAYASNFIYLDNQSVPYPVLYDFTRASTGTYRDGGVLKYAAVNEVRVEDGIDLIEDAGENLALYSNDTTNPAWGLDGLGKVENSGISPDGTQNATETAQIADEGYHYIAHKFHPIVDGTYTFTGSIFVKSDTMQWVDLRLYDLGITSGNRVYASFDILNGVVGALGSVGGTDLGWDIEDIGNGWYRCSVTATFAVTNEVGMAIFHRTNGSISSAPEQFLGDVNVKLLQFGSQIESNESVTSYIPTTTTSETRAADNLTLPTASYLTILQADGTIKQLSSTGDVGENLVINGDFTDGATDWKPYLDTATIASVGDELEITALTNTARAEPTSYIAVNAVRSYVASAYARNGTSGAANSLRLGTSSGQNQLGYVTIPDDTTASARFDEFGVSGLYVSAFASGSAIGGTTYYDNISLVEALPISTTYSQTDSHQFCFNHTSPLTDADISAIEADANLAFRMFFDGEVLPSGFSRANDMVDCNFFGGNEGLASGEFVQDLSVALGAEQVSASADILGINTSITDNGDDTYTVTGTSDSGAMYGYLRLSLTGSSGDLIADLSADLKVKFVVRAKCSSATSSISAVDWGINYVGFDALNTWQYFEFIAVTDGNTGTYMRLTVDEIGHTITFDMNSFSIKELTVVEIEAYNTATRTTLANQSKGATNLKLIQDGSGRTTGTALANTTQWKADGRTAVTNWTITAPFTIGEIIDGVPYLFTSDGNRYKNLIADGTYTVPTGVWTLDEFGFDGVTPVTVRGGTGMIDEVLIP